LWKPKTTLRIDQWVPKGGVKTEVEKGRRVKKKLRGSLERHEFCVAGRSARGLGGGQKTNRCRKAGKDVRRLFGVVQAMKKPFKNATGSAQKGTRRSPGGQCEARSGHFLVVEAPG